MSINFDYGSEGFLSIFSLLSFAPLNVSLLKSIAERTTIMRQPMERKWANCLRLYFVSFVSWYGQWEIHCLLIKVNWIDVCGLSVKICLVGRLTINSVRQNILASSFFRHISWLQLDERKARLRELFSSNKERIDRKIIYQYLGASGKNLFLTFWRLLAHNEALHHIDNFIPPRDVSTGRLSASLVVINVSSSQKLLHWIFG